MGKCPLYSKCTSTVDGSLFDNPADRFRYEHDICKGRGDPPDQWLNCVKYEPTEVPDEVTVAKKEDRNMKIGIVIGFIAGLVLWILNGAFLFLIFFTIYGIGFSSITVTVNAIEEFIEKLIGDTGHIGCLPILLYVFVAPFIACWLPVTSIVGIVRHIKRRDLLK
jgi:hypothetical protein